MKRVMLCGMKEWEILENQNVVAQGYIGAYF